MHPSITNKLITSENLLCSAINVVKNNFSHEHEMVLIIAMCIGKVIMESDIRLKGKKSR
jgi:hypothetical protein